MDRMFKHKGFSLIEFMLTVAVLAVICMSAVPTFSRWIAVLQLQQSRQDLMATLMQARSQAILIRREVSVGLFAGQNTATQWYWIIRPTLQLRQPEQINQITFFSNGSVTAAQVSFRSSKIDTAARSASVGHKPRSEGEIYDELRFELCNVEHAMSQGFVVNRMGYIYATQDRTCSSND